MRKLAVIATVIAVIVEGCTTFTTSTNHFPNYSWTYAIDTIGDEICRNLKGVTAVVLMPDFVSVNQLEPSKIGRIFRTLLSSALSKKCGIGVVCIELADALHMSSSGSTMLTYDLKLLRNHVVRGVDYAVLGMYDYYPGGLLLSVQIVNLRTGIAKKTISLLTHR